MDGSCECNNKQPKKRVQSNGVTVYGFQCNSCGKWESRKRNSFGLYLPTDLYNPDISKKYWERISNERRSEWESKNAQWWDGYNEYLLSDKWKARREAVLKRDGYVCQGCLHNQASEVHHLTYDHVFNELAFELISLCFDCHKKAHAKGVSEI